MKAGISKEEFVTELGKLLALTREGVSGCDLLDNNTVIICYNNGYTRAVNIEMDSGLAIIRDVVRNV